MNNRVVLDVACGSKMFWFNKNHPNVIYNDIRREEHVLCDGRVLKIAPDCTQDFTMLNFPENSFKLVVFDPPHVKSFGKNSWMCKKYGKLTPGWESIIKSGFDQCMRVLDVHGTLIFKWNETEIPLSKILEVIQEKPLFGHTSGRQSKTIWMTFMKFAKN